MELNTKRVLVVLTALQTFDLAVGTGQLKITEHMLPAALIPAITDWASALAFLLGIAITAIAGTSWATDGAPAKPVMPTAGVAAALALAVGLMLCMGGGNAHAQQLLRKPQITGNLAADIKANSAASPSALSGGSLQCDFNLFANIDPKSKFDQIKNCVSAAVNDGVTPFAVDVKTALDSATASKDTVALGCLTPAYAIVQAAAGTPGVPAVAATDTVPAVAAVPAKIPGLVLLFQKFREFTTAGGPSSCQAWIKTTIAGAVVSP